MADPQWWPLDQVVVTGPWANSPKYYAQFGQLGHNAIDLQAAIGTPVYATDDGVIFQEGASIAWSGPAGGIAIIIRHAWGYSGYAHLNQTIVDVGQAVSRGQLIGYSGNTTFVKGGSLGPHLHFETLPPSPNFANGFSGRVNPTAFINLQPRGTTAGGGTTRKDNNDMLIRDQDGTVWQADEWGYDSILDFGAGMSVGELIYAAEILNGAMVQVNNRQRDLINSYARNRWDKKRSQIRDAVIAMMPKVTVDTAAVTKTITDAIQAQGVTVDSAAIAEAVEVALRDEFAVIPAQTAAMLGKKLS